MNSEKKNATILEDVKVNIKIKLSALWVSIMFIYLYVDVFGFLSPIQYHPLFYFNHFNKYSIYYLLYTTSLFKNPSFL